MAGKLVSIITSTDRNLRNRSVDAFARHATRDELLAECAELDAFRRTSRNLYERVRALFFLYAIHRFHLPMKAGVAARGFIPFDGYTYLLRRRFEEAIDVFLRAQASQGQTSPCPTLAEAYHRWAFERWPTGAPQHALRAQQPVDVPARPPGRQPLRVRPELLAQSSDDAPYQS